METLPEISSLEAVDLQCTRGERTLFSGLNFALRGGQLLRVAGANGSGKTSLLRIACGLLEPTRGTVRWGGGDIRKLEEEFRSRLVYIGHSNAIKDDLTAEENLRFACALARVGTRREQTAEALGRLGLSGFERVPARALSQGQRRRVALARLALSDSAPLWLLDEPFAALDTAATAAVESLIEAHLARGGIAMYSTHHESRITAGKSLRIDLGGQART